MATETIVAFSDFLSVKTTHENTRFIEYSNQSSFAGIDYVNDPRTFGIRVLSKFFVERDPEEDESEELSDGDVVKLSGSVKTQKLLELEPLPYYMHKKLKLILQHNYILIDDEEYTKEEAYEIGEPMGQGRYPFTLGKVWMTLKNSFVTNVFGEV